MKTDQTKKRKRGIKQPPRPKQGMPLTRMTRKELEAINDDANREMVGDDACYFEGEDIGNR